MMKNEEVAPETVSHNDTLVFHNGTTGRVFSMRTMDNGTRLFTCCNLAGTFFTVAAGKGDTVTRRTVEA